MDSFGNRIKHRLLDLRMSAAALTRQVGISRAQMQNWTKGLNSPRNENLQKLATALQVTPEWLVTGAGDTHALKAVAATGVNGMFDAYQRLPSQNRKDLRELMDVWARVQA